MMRMSHDIELRKGARYVVSPLHTRVRKAYVRAWPVDGGEWYDSAVWLSGLLDLDGPVDEEDPNGPDAPRFVGEYVAPVEGSEDDEHEVLVPASTWNEKQFLRVAFLFCVTRDGFLVEVPDLVSSS